MIWLLIISAILNVLLLWLAFWTRAQRRQDRIWAADKVTEAVVEKWEWHNKHDALEIGMTEQEENYEQQFLSFKEMIEAQKVHLEYKDAVIRDLEEEVNYHRANCLPVVGRPILPELISTGSPF